MIVQDHSVAVNHSAQPFQNGKRCLGTHFITGDILPLGDMNQSATGLTVGKIERLITRDGRVAGYVFGNMDNSKVLVSGTNAMSIHDARLSGYFGGAQGGWLTELAAAQLPWKDLKLGLCASAYIVSR